MAGEKRAMAIRKLIRRQGRTADAHVLELLFPNVPHGGRLSSVYRALLSQEELDALDAGELAVRIANIEGVTREVIDRVQALGITVQDVLEEIRKHPELWPPGWSLALDTAVSTDDTTTTTSGKPGKRG